MRNISVIIGVFMGLMSLISCSADWHIKRAIKKDPRIIQQAIVRYHRDTLQIVTDGARGDTVFMFEPSPRDTFILERDKFRTIVITDTLWRTIKIDTECFPDTVYREIEVPQYIMQPVIDEMNWWERMQKNVGAFALILLLIVIFVLILKYTLTKAK